MTARDLLLRMKAAARVGKVSADLRAQFNAEAAAFGPEAMAEAQRRLGEALEARRAASDS